MKSFNLSIFQSKRGQSLIEIIVAISIGAILIGGATAIIVPILRSNLETRNVQIATSLAQEYLDNVQAIAESNWHLIYTPPSSKGPSSQFYLRATSTTYETLSGTTSTVVEGRTFTRYFSIENVNRTSCGVGNATTTATTTCNMEPGDSYIAEDPSTQKITATVSWPEGRSISRSQYLTRSRNKVFVQTDWSGGPSPEPEVPITAENNQFATSSNINYASTTGSIKILLAYTSPNGSICTQGSECDSTFCVNGYCCNTACNSNTCERCDSYSSAGAGTCGYVSSSFEDPDNECTTASPGQAGSCKSNTCSGTSYSCGYLAAGEQSQPSCKRCSGSSYDPVSVADNTQDTEGSNLCNATCVKCSGGGCANQSSAEDLFGQCAAATYIKQNVASNQSCSTICASYACNTGNCSGGGACEGHTCYCASVGTDAGGTNGLLFLSGNGCNFSLSSNCNHVNTAYPGPYGYICGEMSNCNCQ